MKRLLLTLALLAPLAAWADETLVLPKGAFALEVQRSASKLDKQWSNDRQPLSLLDESVRYEPGGGLQGILTARPVVQFDFLITQLLYGVTDQLSVGAVVPIVLGTRIETNLGWREGDYMSQLGRPYSQEDFWQWAESMGQPRPPDRWEGNRGKLGDIVLAARWQLTRAGWMERMGLTAAISLQASLPTGSNADPEQLVVAGTNGWDLHAYGDAEVHLAAKQALWTDGAGLERLSVNAELFAAWLRPRTFATAKGTQNPLLLTYQPYVGDTYVIDGGDWLAGSLIIDAALIAGPTFATLVSGNSLEKAQGLPALLSVSAGYTFVATGQTRWISDSALWSWDREKLWGPGEKHLFRANVTVSLLRVGLPVQLYGNWRGQELIAGRNTRPSSMVGAGVRLLGKFW